VDIIDSDLENPIVTFSSPGSTQVGLICWSDNGCYDTLQSNGPPIYIEPTELDSCWTIVNDGFDVSGNTSTYSLNYDFTPSRSGFITCGTSTMEKFASLYGDSLTVPMTVGYLAKYNSNGILKWMVHCTGGTNYKRLIYQAIEDSIGNIYLSGTSGAYLTSDPLDFYDNAGDSVRLSSYGNFIIKLDSSGKFLWRLSRYDEYFTQNRLAIDRQGNLIVWETYSSTYPFSFNGVPVVLPDTVQNTNSLLLKISPSGNIVWNTGISGVGYVSSSYIGLAKIQVDDSDNIYITGPYYGSVTFYSRGNLSPQILNGNINNNRSLFVAKYNSSGALLWKLRSITDLGSSGFTLPLDMVTDNNGNCYISGKNNAHYYTYHQIFENTDGSTTSTTAGQYFVAKIDANGICEWLNGAANSFYGFGYNITKKDNEISVLGRILSNGSGPQTSLFTSSNNIGIELTINKGDYFVADYDTLGNLLRIITNGNNPLTTAIFNLSDPVFSGMFRNDDGSYLLATNFGFPSASYNYMNFMTNLNDVHNHHYGVTKFQPGCGITVYPDVIATDIGITSLSGIHSSTCGGSYDFSNDSIITVHLQNFSNTSIPANADIILTCTINDTILVIDTLTLSSAWQPGQIIDHTLSQPAGLLPNGPNTIVVSINGNNPGSTNNSIQQTASNFLIPSAAFNVSSFCQNDVVFENTSTTPAGTLSYQWMFGDSTTSNYPSPTKNYSAAGIYDVTLIATSNGCSDTITQQITVLPAPVVTLSLPPQLCTSLTPLALSGGQPAGGIYYGTGIFNNIFSSWNLSPGLYYIYYIYTDSSTGCSNTAMQQIQLLQAQYISMYPFEDVCIDDVPFILLAGYPQGGIYSGDGISNNIFNPQSAGLGTHDIYYTYTNPVNGCSATTLRQIEVVTDPIVTLPAFSPVCTYSDPLTLSGGQPPGGTYSGVGVYNNIFYPDTIATGIGYYDIEYSFTTSGGCNGLASQQIEVSPCTAIEEIDHFLIMVYPNPSSGTINLEFPVLSTSSVQIEIRNLLGQLVYYYTDVADKGICKKTFKPDLAEGVYSLSIQTKEYEAVRKIDIVK
jgi:hypothetical protein